MRIPRWSPWRRRRRSPITTWATTSITTAPSCWPTASVSTWAFAPREGDPAPPQPALPFQYGTPDGYEFYLDMGSLANADEKYFKHQQPYWNLNIDHTTYDEVWQSRAIWKYLKDIKPAVMLVGGWYDTEDPQGPLRQFDFMEKNTPPAVDMLVMGPWNHGGFSRGDGDRLGNVNFGSKTAQYYREQIEFPFFVYYLKGKRRRKVPQGLCLPDRHEPVAQVRPVAARRRQAHQPSTSMPKASSPGSSRAQAAFDEYLSDPNKPVPYIGRVTMGVLNTYMTEDQRFAAARPDVLVYKTDVLDHDVTVLGPIAVDLKVSTTGTDSDFVVKLIDVYPGDAPDYKHIRRSPACRRLPPSPGPHGRLPAAHPRRAVPREIPQELREAGALRARQARPHRVQPARRRPHLPARAIASWCRFRAVGSR